MKTEKVYIEYLLLQVQAGESNALNQLLQIIRNKMMAFAKRYMIVTADADDCVQEAMVVICQQLKNLQNHHAFHGWMYKVLHSKCLDSWRKNNRHAADSIGVQDFIDDSIEDQSIDQQIDVNRAMQMLVPEFQTVVYLFYFEGFKVVEIADILKKPAGTVKSLLFTAREKIKSLVNQESNHEY
jgi:RNA polymerase sigma-70 factor (ECF subfamily)